MRIRRSLAEDYLALVDKIDQQLSLPGIRKIFIPRDQSSDEKSAEFGAVILEDGSVGLVFLLLGDTLQRFQEVSVERDWIGESPVSLAKKFLSLDPIEKALGLGAINAVGQNLIKRSGIQLDTATNSIASFDPQANDKFGMIGYFPPLVSRLREAEIDLTVVELKEELVESQECFRVTLNPKSLVSCNKVLCTSTMLLNDTLDQMLSYCDQDAQVALIGPSAGFLPDALFSRGITTVGGNQIIDVELFIQRCEDGEKWGQSSRKYCFHQSDYPGIDRLIAQCRS